jgi:DNA replication protein
MFELKHIDDLVRIAAAGGGFTLDASMKHTNDLVRIAAAASRTGTKITLRGLSLRPVDDLVRISAAGNGCVQFSD